MPVKEALEKAGWNQSALAGISDLPWSEVLEMLLPVTGRLNFGEELHLKGLMVSAAHMEGLENKKFARGSITHFKDDQWDKAYGSSAETPMTGVEKWEQLRKNAPRARWPTRFQRKLEELPEGHSREQLEKGERVKAIQQLAELLVKCNLWMPADGDSARPGFGLSKNRFAMGRRLSTLRQHLRMGRRIHQFAEVQLGKTWFECPEDFYDWVQALLEEPCGKHVPRASFNTLKFLEHSVEMPDDLQLSRDAGILNFLKEVEQAGGWKAGRVRRKAQPYLLEMVAAMEGVVVAQDTRPYHRFYAWIKLIKLWCAMRFDDVQGVDHENLKLRRDGVLYGELWRTKTSGIGKKVERLNFFISPGAWVLHANWLHRGFTVNTALSRSSAMEDRDYLVPKPQPNLMGFRKSMVKYPDALIMGRALLRELPLLLEARDGGHVRADGRLIDLEAVGFWSEHSERGSMDTWMELAKVPKEIRCMLGRWATSNEEGYLRHLEASVCGAQVKVAEMLRSPPTAELAAHEDEVVKKLSRYLEGRGMDQSRIDRQVFRLQSSLRGGDSGSVYWKQLSLR